MRTIKQLLYALALLLTLAGCSDDADFRAPAFLHVDAIRVVKSTINPPSADDGFYTHEITSCYVVARRQGASSIDTLGLFQLPFTVPVLIDGPVEYLEVSPAVKQSGVSAAQPYYTFYNRIYLRDTAFVSGDTLWLDTLSTTYATTCQNLFFEPFEPTQGSLFFDSVVWHQHAAADACSGEGYASVHVADTVAYVPFAINRNIGLPDNGSRAVYLELDTRSDLPFEVYMQAAYTTGGSLDVQRVMVVNPSDHWQHMYINLGRTWAWFNHPLTFRLSFSALNVEGEEGDIRIDNVKIVTTSQLL